MSEPVADQVRQTIAEVFLIDPAAGPADASAETVEAWDSIGHLNLVLALEQRFGVSFDPEKIPQLTTVEAIAAAVADAAG